MVKRKARRNCLTAATTTLPNEKYTGIVADVARSCCDGCGESWRGSDDTSNAVRLITAATGIRWLRQEADSTGSLSSRTSDRVQQGIEFEWVAMDTGV